MTEEPAGSVGDEQLEVAHRQILRRVQQISAAVAERRREELPSALKFLHGFLGEHFAHEEAWMAEMGYPGAREHARLHALMLDRFADARRRAKDDPADPSAWVAALVGDLQEHMRREDVKLSRFATARENLRLLAEAGPGVGAALTPLPGSHGAVRPARPAPRPTPQRR